MRKTRNHVQLIGYLGKDPVKRSAGETEFFNFSLATDEYRRDRTESTKRLVTWHDICVGGKLAKSMPGQFIQGSHVLVEGAIKYRTYIDRTGIKNRVAEIHATNLLDLDR